MEPEAPRLEHVGETALMVAGCRALETGRTDGLIRDPYAERLAGERGMALARSVPALEWMVFGVAVRVRFMDELLLKALGTGEIRTVVVLGAGLDSRPWRLEMPGDLRWIESDFQEMLDYKAAALASETPRCRVDRIAADLNDPSQRRRVFEAAGGEAALIVTEGLLMYLPAGTVRAIATEPAALCGARRWLMDIYSAQMMSIAPRERGQLFGHLRAADHLSGDAILNLATECGWTSLEHRSYTRDAWLAASHRILALAPDIARVDSSSRPPPDDPSGVYLLGLAGAAI